MNETMEMKQLVKDLNSSRLTAKQKAATIRSEVSQLRIIAREQSNRLDKQSP